MVMKEHCATVWLIDVFLILLGQLWRSMAQRNKIYQALDTQMIPLSRINSLLVLICS